MALSVIVTGAGGAAGVAVIQSLRHLGHRTIAADADETAAGMQLADEAGIVPRGDDPRFAGVLCDLALRTEAEALVCTVAEEMVALNRAADELGAVGLATWLPTSEVVETCVDKWRFAAALEASGFPGPLTGLASADGIPGPWIVKPRFGRGSRHVFAIDHPEDLPSALRQVPGPIVQTRLAGAEFTVDALVAADGSLAGAVPRWRLDTRGGISTKGRTFEHEQLAAAVGKLLGALGLCGPANVQGFVDESGTFAFTEVNPRFSGGLPLSIAAGADLVGEYVRGVVGLPVRAERLRYRSGVTMTRYLAELFTP